MNSEKPDKKILNKKDWGIGFLLIGMGLIVFARSHPITKMGGKLVNHVWHTTTIIIYSVVGVLTNHIAKHNTESKNQD